MKQIINIAILTFFVGICSSCTDWLDQKSDKEIAGSELYQTESGAQEALNGLYLGMLNRSLYGGELTAGMIEALAMHYAVPEGNPYYDVTNSYTSASAQSYLLSIWKGLYKSIAECNVFLANIEQNQGNYDAEYYKLYRGEALALRTFLHFDLFRMFAPAWSEANKTQPAIPYYDREVEQPLDYLTVEQIMTQLLKDIDDAIVLLAGDPILNSSDNAQAFWKNRTFRFNIYAAWALKARICLHTGDKATAHTITTALLEGKNPAGGAANNFMEVFPSVLTIVKNYQDPLCYTETIFGMHDVNREELYKKYFSNELEETRVCGMSEINYSKLFPQPGDIRQEYFTIMTTQEGTISTLKNIAKWQYSTSFLDKYPYRYQNIPLIRKGEIYLIAAESSDNDTDKQHWLEQLRLNRGFNIDNVSGDLNTVLQEEYERELYAEGQYFYFLKRNGITSLPTQDLPDKDAGSVIVKTVSESYYVLPVPEEEINNRINN